MRRWIYTYRYVDGDPARLETTLLTASAELLRLATAAPDVQPAGDGSFLFEVETRIAHVDLGKQARVELGVARRSGDRVILPLSWRAEPAARLFPRFTGGLELEPIDSGVAQLTLSGTYEIPFGVLGSAVDATILREVSHRTAERLIEAISEELVRAVERGLPVAPTRAGGRRPVLVRDVMTPNPVVLDESLPLRTAALILFSCEVSGAPVVRADGELIGVLSEADLLAKEADERYGWGRGVAAEDRRRRATTVGHACSRPARVTAPEARLAAATREMLDHDTSRLVVVGQGRIVGIVTRHDVLGALVRDDRQLLTEVRTLLETRGAGDVHAAVEWGTVTLRGTTRLRTTANTVSRMVERIDGVVAVDDDELDWVEDDVLPRISAAPM